jgi:hypothetical protein
MPIALLLQATFKSLDKGTRLLEHWNQLVEIEILLIGRARSAFLIHWFGRSLPLEGSSLRIAIQNLGALRQRYQDVRSAPPALSSGPNLLEPLAGLGGTLIGILASPTGVLLLGTAIVPRSGSFLKGLLLALAFILGIGIVPLLAGGVAIAGMPLGALSAIAMAQGGNEMARDLYNLLGALAQMLETFRAFAQQLMGPRSGVRNPLVRQVLEIFDRLAVLVPHVIALVALIFTRIGPLLVPLALQAQRLLGLVDAVMAAIHFIWDDFMRRLVALYEDPPAFMELEVYLGALSQTAPPVLQGAFDFLQRLVALVGQLVGGKPSPFTVMKTVFGLLKSIGPILKNGLHRLFKSLGNEFRGVRTAMSNLVDAWLPEARRAFTDELTSHPLIASMLLLRDELQIIQRVLASTAPPAPSARAPSSTPSASTPAAPASTTPPSLARRIAGAVLPLPSLPDVAALEAAAGGRPTAGFDIDSLRSRASGLDLETLAPSLFLSDEARQAVDRVRQPLDVFADERRRLVDSQGRSPAQQLEDLRTQELPLRQALVEVVRRLFPPAVSKYLPKLQSLFETLDREIYGVAVPAASATPAEPLPVQDLPESNRLKPVVHRLHVQAHSDDEPSVRAWTEFLRRALETQTYTVEA